MALKRIKIIDLSRLLPGPYCSMILGDLGAEIIRVDDPKFIYSSMPPYLQKGNYTESALNSIIMRNKRSIKLNLKKEEALDVFYDLVKQADVVLESYRPGTAKKLHVDYESVKNINKSIIYCSISGFGQDGPYSNFPGHDLNYLGISGQLEYKMDHPRVPLIQTADLSASFNAAIGILTAIIARINDPKHRGQYIDISILDSSFALNPILASIVFSGSNFSPLYGDYPFYNIYETKDQRFLTLGAIENKFWVKLCKILEIEPDFCQKQMSTGETRNILFNLLKKKFKSKTSDEWEVLFQNKDIPIMRVNTFEEACSDPQLLARNMIIELDHPRLARIKNINNPIKLSQTPPKIRSLAIKPGFDSSEILKELGYSEEKIKQLKRKGIHR